MSKYPKISIPFNLPATASNEGRYINEALISRHLSGDGTFTKRCHDWLQNRLSARAALLTHSCTAALEMSCILANIEPGDEVIMPSFTFVSTANAVVLRGAIPVFVDIRPDTLNIDESKIEEAITPKTKAILVVHYAGVSAEMTAILALAKNHDLVVIEDAAQGILATYKGQALGTIGSLGALSFHETKNVVSGEGGALIVNDQELIQRAEIIREKGTNRSQFFRGQVDKYTWVDVGSSYLPGEVTAALLLAQLEDSDAINNKRMRAWDQYHDAFDELETRFEIRRPTVPDHCGHNGHLYYLLTHSLEQRTRLIEHLKNRGVGAVFHYVPLHSSPGGLRYGKTPRSLPITDDSSERLLRLPLWADLTNRQIEQVAEAVFSFYKSETDI